MLASLFEYKAWANEALLSEFEARYETIPEADRHAAIRTLNHAYVVDRIFAAHLVGDTHGYTATNTIETPELHDLHRAIADSDQGLVDYVDRVTPEALAEEIDFVFTDGAKGRMSRQEMLLHLVLHGGYHRGQVGTKLPQLSAASFRDTFTTFLHDDEPDRRR